MPITDDDYEPFTEDELYEQLADDLEALTEGEVEDAESSAIQSLLRAHARLLSQNQEQSLERLYDAGYIETASGEQLNRKVREVGIQRNEATPATGVATFLREEEPTTDYIIQRGTPITTANGEVTFSTTENGSLQFITGFEDASLDSAWNEDTASFTPTTTKADRGSQSVEIAATSGVAIYRNNETVSQGDRIRASLYLPTNAGIGVRFGVIDNSRYHAVSVDSGTGTMSLIRGDGTETSLDSTGVQVPNGAWITVEIDTETTGEVDVRLLDGSGESIAAVSDTDISFQGTGVGIDYGGTNAEIGNTLHENVGLTERLVGGFFGTAVTYTVTDELLADDETYTWSEPNIDDIDLTLDIVVDEAYAGDEAVKSALVEYIGGTDVDGAVVTGTEIGEEVRVDAIRDRVVGPDLGVRGIASITIDADGDGTDDTTTDANGLRVYEVPDSDVAQTDAVDGSIVLTKTEV